MDFSNETLAQTVKNIYHLIVARALECAYLLTDDESKEAIHLADRDFKETLKWNPKHLRRAYYRHRQDIFENGEAELLQMLAAFKLGAIKDDDEALALYDEWQASHANSLDWLKEQIRERRGKRQKPSLAHRVAMILNDERSKKLDRLAEIPEIVSAQRNLQGGSMSAGGNNGKGALEQLNERGERKNDSGEPTRCQ